MPSASSAPTGIAQPSAPLSGEDLARLGRCIAQQAPYLSQDRIDRAKVWTTTPETARAALQDYVPIFESEPQAVLLVLLDGEFTDQYGLADGTNTTAQLWFATPGFATAEDYMPGTGMAACDPDESQLGTPLQGVEESLLGQSQVLPVALIQEDGPIEGIRSPAP